MSVQPDGCRRDQAEARLTERLAQCARYPDAAMVTVFLGDLRELAERLKLEPAE